MLDYKQLQTVINPRKQQFVRIKQKYPELKAYLVLCRRWHQTDTDATPQQILQELPDMIVDSPDKEAGINILWRIEVLQFQHNHEEIAKLQTQLEKLCTSFSYHTDATVEIRFKQLKYDLIWKLQADDLVDRELTPQTMASIRIVLGPLPHLVDVKASES